MTIKELADALGVSKTAVRKHMTEEFRDEHTETNRNGVIAIDSEGCKLIAMHLGRTEKLAGTAETKDPETEKTTGNEDSLLIPRAVWDALQAQLEAKDRQIADLTATIRKQADSVQGAQALHAGTMQQQMLPDAEPAPIDADSDPKPGFWQYLKSYFS